MKLNTYQVNSNSLYQVLQKSLLAMMDLLYKSQLSIRSFNDVHTFTIVSFSVWRFNDRQFHKRTLPVCNLNETQMLCLTVSVTIWLNSPFPVCRNHSWPERLTSPRDQYGTSYTSMNHLLFSRNQIVKAFYDV